MSSTGLSIAQLDELAKYDTPTVCNAIELFEVRPRNTGFMDHRIKADSPDLPPMVGYALTTTFRSDAPASKDSYGGVKDQLDLFDTLPGRPVVVFQDLDDPTRAATFGEMMCGTYKKFGAAGLITSGGGRDLEQVHDQGFPTFTGSTICAHGYCHFNSIGEEVRVGGLNVRQGDLLHGDRNGVTSIPHEIADELADACAALIWQEKVFLDYVTGDEPASMARYEEVLKEARARLAEIQGKFSRKG